MYQVLMSQGYMNFFKRPPKSHIVLESASGNSGLISKQTKNKNKTIHLMDTHSSSAINHYSVPLHREISSESFVPTVSPLCHLTIIFQTTQILLLFPSFHLNCSSSSFKRYPRCQSNKCSSVLVLVSVALNHVIDLFLLEHSSPAFCHATPLLEFLQILDYTIVCDSLRAYNSLRLHVCFLLLFRTQRNYRFFQEVFPIQPI